MNDINISIIVPVYQAEKFLEKCLKSLINQNIDEYEIICIDDGSTDSSAEIIHKLQQNAPNLKYFYQKNQGVSAARNRGIELANGKYIMFVDSDDTIKKNCLGYLYRKAEQKKCDILVFGGKTDIAFRAPEWMRMALYTKNRDYGVFVPDILYHEPGAQPSACNKLFRRGCIGKVRFPHGISIAEDMTFLCILFPRISKVSFIKKRVYSYRISNFDSAMHQTEKQRLKHMESHVRAAEMIIDAWISYGLLENDNRQFAKWLTSFLRAPYKSLEGDEKLLVLNEIEKIYSSIGSSNLLLLPELHGEDPFSITRLYRIITRDIKSYGFIGGIENIVFKLFFRNR